MAGKSSVSKTAALMRRLIEGGMEAAAAERAVVQRGPTLLAADEDSYVDTAAAQILEEFGLDADSEAERKTPAKKRDGAGDTPAERYAKRKNHSAAWGTS